MSGETGSTVRVRLDKWLWAARFFRTRALAKKAIEGGHVMCDDARPKPSRDIAVGVTLTIRQGYAEKTVVVRRLSDQRRDATFAQTLYEETLESIEKREAERLQRRFSRLGLTMPRERPTKRDRRAIDRLREGSEALASEELDDAWSDLSEEPDELDGLEEGPEMLNQHGQDRTRDA